jgi:hypothetical protein
LFAARQQGRGIVINTVVTTVIATALLVFLT